MGSDGFSLSVFSRVKFTVRLQSSCGDFAHSPDGGKRLALLRDCHPHTALSGEGESVLTFLAIIETSTWFRLAWVAAHT